MACHGGRGMGARVAAFYFLQGLPVCLTNGHSARADARKRNLRSWPRRAVRRLPGSMGASCICRPLKKLANTSPRLVAAYLRMTRIGFLVSDSVSSFLCSFDCIRPNLSNFWRSCRNHERPTQPIRCAATPVFRTITIRRKPFFIQITYGSQIQQWKDLSLTSTQSCQWSAGGAIPRRFIL